MPTGPKDHKRPADVIGSAVRVSRIATGEEEDAVIDNGQDANARRSAPRVEEAAENMTRERRAKIAKKGAEKAGAIA